MGVGEWGEGTELACPKPNVPQAVKPVTGRRKLTDYS